MIRALYFNDEGRKAGESEETVDESRHILPHPDNGVEQVSAGEVHFQNKGTQRRPANPAFARHVKEEF